MINSLHFKAPQKTHKPSGFKSIFLGGSIENGAAELWQDALSSKILAKNKNVVIYNPRREIWDANLSNSIDNPIFKEQVDWEYNHIIEADLVLLYFQPNTQSPISLLEFGLLLEKNLDSFLNKRLIVCCPHGFWRKGNVDFLCEKFGIRTIEKIDDLLNYI